MMTRCSYLYCVIVVYIAISKYVYNCTLYKCYICVCISLYTFLVTSCPHLYIISLYKCKYKVIYIYIYLYLF